MPTAKRPQLSVRRDVVVCRGVSDARSSAKGVYNVKEAARKMYCDAVKPTFKYDLEWSVAWKV